MSRVGYLPLGDRLAKGSEPLVRALMRIAFAQHLHVEPGHAGTADDARVDGFEGAGPKFGDLNIGNRLQQAGVADQGRTTHFTAKRISADTKCSNGASA